MVLTSYFRLVEALKKKTNHVLQLLLNKQKNPQDQDKFYNYDNSTNDCIHFKYTQARYLTCISHWGRFAWSII